MKHNCALKKEGIASRGELKWYQKYTLISFDNPLRLGYFRSDISVKEEQLRQVKISKYIIHPFSKFRAWYDMYLIYVYASVLITKPFDAGFTKTLDCLANSIYMYYNLIVDALCWIDIVLNFLTGYERKSLHIIELRKWKIAKKYLFSPYFICDVLSSTPKCLIYVIAVHFTSSSWRLTIGGLTSVLGLFKAVRIISFVKCIGRTADYLSFKARGLLFIICTLFGFLMILHWLACMQFAVPRLYRISFAPVVQNTSWFYSKHIYNGTLYTNQNSLVQYNHCFFKSTGYIMGIHSILYPVKGLEEYALAMFTYFTGKILVTFIWIILLVVIINGRIMEIKFAEIINQLEEYMKQKQLPLNLRRNMLQHYDFKYQNRYFHEDQITGLLSENLRMEVQMHICKSLIDNVSLFRELSHIEISKVVHYLTPEIFLPNDTIIHAGTQGDAMYFLATGTVVVYTRSGKEICHLQDGAYFGEISLVIKGQLRSATIVALETSQVFKLNKKDLEKHLLSNRAVMNKVLQNAEERLSETAKLEDQYRELILENSLRQLTLQ